MSNVARVAGQAANTLSKPLNVEDVFSTYLYEGNGSTQTITNGIDLDGEGGMVWLARRTIPNFSQSHYIVDTERGGNKFLQTYENAAQSNDNSLITSFNSNGFTMGNTIANTSGDDVSWTFRKAKKFFDVVTYTGDGTTNRQIPHNLGSAPGCIIVKRTNGLKDWAVYHRGKGSTHYGALNTNEAFYDYHTWWQDTDPTSTNFTVGNSAFVNANGDTYVAYLFAHNDGDGEFGPDGDADIIKCGSYTGTGSSGNFVDLGFEPQFMLIKNTSSSANWIIHDNMRGMIETTGNVLFPNRSDAENTTAFRQARPNATGITFFDGNSETNGSGSNYIYIAISRGPTAVPESATEVFSVSDFTGDGTSNRTITTSNLVDLSVGKGRYNTTFDWAAQSRLQGSEAYLKPHETGAEGSNSGNRIVGFDVQAGYTITGSFYNNSGSPNVIYNWKRAPGFFDAVCYTGEGTKQTISHNLGVAPEMMWIKVRSTTQHWAVYHPDLPGSGKFISLNNTWDGNNTNSNFWDGETPTSTTFSVGATSVNNLYVNGSGHTYIAYLFASLDGVSKVGSYTGNDNGSNSQVIDCGFSSGARFVLIKVTSTSGDWYVFDTERGIVAGDDPYLLLNTTGAEQTVWDGIDPHSSGFEVTSSTLNVSGETYIFYAIA